MMNREVFIAGYGVKVLCKECSKLIGDLMMFEPQVIELSDKPCHRCQTANCDPVYQAYTTTTSDAPWETWNDQLHGRMVVDCLARSKTNPLGRRKP